MARISLFPDIMVLLTALNKIGDLFVLTNYISKCLDYQKKLIDTITTSNFYLKFKENNENYMAAQVFFWLSFIPAVGQAKSAQQMNFDGAVIPTLIFSIVGFDFHVHVSM